MLHPRTFFVLTAALAAAVLISCGDDPNDPNSPNNPNSPSGINRPPVAQFTTNPAATNGRIQDDAPLSVTFNMCGSTDPDSGDQLRYEFYFRGDGTGNPDATGACRADHTYGNGNGVCVPATQCVWDRQPGADHRICRTYSVCAN